MVVRGWGGEGGGVRHQATNRQLRHFILDSLLSAAFRLLVGFRASFRRVQRTPPPKKTGRGPLPKPRIAFNGPPLCLGWGTGLPQAGTPTTDTWALLPHRAPRGQRPHSLATPAHWRPFLPGHGPAPTKLPHPATKPLGRRMGFRGLAAKAVAAIAVVGCRFLRLWPARCFLNSGHKSQPGRHSMGGPGP